MPGVTGSGPGHTTGVETGHTGATVVETDKGHKALCPLSRQAYTSLGTLIIFFGARYAHAVTASADCVRVTGWVCRAGRRVIDNGGSVLVRLVGWTVDRNMSVFEFISVLY